MIRVLGVRRLMFLVVLVAVNAAFSAMAYLVLVPQNVEKSRDLRRAQSRVASLQKDINNLQVELEELEVQQKKFDILKNRGFFNPQNRREAQEILEQIQDQSGIINATVTIQPGEIEEFEAATKAGHHVVKSSASVDIQAVDDIAVYKYIAGLQRLFPGDITISNLHVERKSNVTGVLLRGIASGFSPPLVVANMDLLWRTMIPQDKPLDQTGEGQP